MIKSLRSQVIRLAHAEPELRSHLLPLVRSSMSRQGYDDEEYTEEELRELKEEAKSLFLDTDPATLEAVDERYSLWGDDIRRMLDDAAGWASVQGLQGGSWSGDLWGEGGVTWKLEGSGDFRVKISHSPREGVSVIVQVPGSSLKALSRGGRWDWGVLERVLRKAADQAMESSHRYPWKIGAALFVLKGADAFASYMAFPKEDMKRLIRSVFPKARVTFQDRSDGPMWFVHHPLMVAAAPPSGKQKPFGELTLRPPGKKRSVLRFEMWPSRDRALSGYTARLDTASVVKFLGKIKKKLEAAAS